MSSPTFNFSSGQRSVSLILLLDLWIRGMVFCFSLSRYLLFKMRSVLMLWSFFLFIRIILTYRIISDLPAFHLKTIDSYYEIKLIVENEDRSLKIDWSNDKKIINIYGRWSETWCLRFSEVRIRTFSRLSNSSSVWNWSHRSGLGRSKVESLWQLKWRNYCTWYTNLNRLPEHCKD